MNSKLNFKFKVVAEKSKRLTSRYMILGISCAGIGSIVSIGILLYFFWPRKEATPIQTYDSNPPTQATRMEAHSEPGGKNPAPNIIKN